MCRRIEFLVQDCDDHQCWRWWISKALCPPCREGFMALLAAEETQT
jgi:hypothetical protein